MSASIEIDRVVEAQPVDVLAAMRSMSESQIPGDLRAAGVVSENVAIRGNKFTAEFTVTFRQNGRAQLTGMVRQEGSYSRVIGRCGSARSDLYVGIFFAVLAATVAISFGGVVFAIPLILLAAINVFLYYSPSPTVQGQMMHLKLRFDRALGTLVPDEPAKVA